MFESLVASGLMRSAPPLADRTERWEASKHRETLAQCESFFLYNESGWTHLVGYQHLRNDKGEVYDRRRILNLHFNSADERANVLASRNLVACGDGVRPMTDKDREARYARFDPRYRPRYHRSK